jgi:hypothetical protein
MNFMAMGLGLFQMGSGIAGAGYQKDLDRDQVELEYQSDLEDIRRREFDQQSVQGTAKAFSENAGVLHSGGSSAQGFLNTMAEQFTREINFMKNFAREARSLGYKQASLKHRTGVMGALTSGMKTMGS